MLAIFPGIYKIFRDASQELVSFYHRHDVRRKDRYPLFAYPRSNSGDSCTGRPFSAMVDHHWVSFMFYVLVRTLLSFLKNLPEGYFPTGRVITSSPLDVFQIKGEIRRVHPTVARQKSSVDGIINSGSVIKAKLVSNYQLSHSGNCLAHESLRYVLQCSFPQRFQSFIS